MRAAPLARHLDHSARGGEDFSGRRSPRAPAPDLWDRVCRDHTISRRELNLFKPLRHHFRASRFAAGPSDAATPAAEAPQLERPTIGSSGAAFAGRAPRCAPSDRLQATAGGTASTNRTLSLLPPGGGTRTNTEHPLKLVKQLFRWAAWELPATWGGLRGVGDPAARAFGGIDGMVGESMRSAVRAYRAPNGLAPDG